MAVTLIVGVVVGLTSITVGEINASKAAKAAASVAATQEQQSLYNATQSNKTALQIAQGNNFATIFSAVDSKAICGNTQLRLQQQANEGQVLIIIGVCITVLSLALLVIRKNKSAPAG